MRSQSAIDLQQRFDMATALYRMAEKMNDVDEIDNQYELL